MNLVVVTRPGEGLGFRLAGARVEEIAPGDEAARLPPLLAAPDAGVVAVEEAVLAGVPEALLERAARKGTPIVFPFALPRRLAEPGRAETYVGLLIRRAIGYHVRLK
jgi:V/A-type H+/Na+-transporting ATPase subunit F